MAAVLLCSINSHHNAHQVGDSSFLETVGLGMHRLLWSVLLTVVLMSLFYAGLLHSLHQSSILIYEPLTPPF